MHLVLFMCVCCSSLVSRKNQVEVNLIHNATVSQCLLHLSLPTHISIHVERWQGAAAVRWEAHRELQVSSFKDLGCQQTQGLCSRAGRGGDQ